MRIISFSHRRIAPTVTTIVLTIFIHLSLFSWATAFAEDSAKFHVIDVGTGMSVYMEFPAPSGADSNRPIRVVYDTGLDSEALVAFLKSKEIGLRASSGEDRGDVIDYFFLSHPNEDHFAGAKNLFAAFDVRNIVESKQSDSSKYISQFKIPALQELADARERGFEGNLYIVGLPYPNDFKFPKSKYGKAYDEYALTQKYLPEFLKRKRGFKVDATDEKFPFLAVDVAQEIDFPLEAMIGKENFTDNEEDLSKVGKDFKTRILPIGAQFRFSQDSIITIMHGDSVAGLNYAIQEDDPYEEAFPYFSEFDANDSSVAIRVAYKNSSLFIPGDCEGHKKKPKATISLEELLGLDVVEYSKSELDDYLKPSGGKREINILRGFNRLRIGNRELLDLIVNTYVSFDQINPEPIDIEANGNSFKRETKDFSSPQDFEGLQALSGMSNARKRRAKENLFAYFELMKTDANVTNAARGQFKSWSRGGNPKLICEDICSLNVKEDVWNLMQLMQLASRLYIVDPQLANVFAGLILSSEMYLEYVAPEDPKERSLRAERHMIDVAEIITRESPGAKPLRSDILIFGHHGSFTSSSIGFIRAVEPNVGIISADDKVYGSGGGSLPDFLHLFWNINTYHEKPRQALHTLFFQADMVRIAKGIADPEVLEARRSDTAADIFARRGRNPIPIWRTDWNDDLTNSNTLTDNIGIHADGTPIWMWARGVNSELMRRIFDGHDENHYRYLEVMLFDRPDFETLIRPLDPRTSSPQIWTYSSTLND